MSEPVVRNPQLRALVELARSQRAPEVKVTIQDVWRRGEAERARSRGWIVGGVVALAAGLVAWLAASTPDGVEREGGETTPAQASKVVDAEASSAGVASPREAEGATPKPTTADETVARDQEGVEVPPEPTLALAEGVVIEPIGDAAPATVISTWKVEVAGGRYRVETPANGAVLEIVVGRRITRIQPGSKLTFDATTRAPDDVEVDPTPVEIARQAEQAMAAGERAEAIKALTKLVRKHPMSAQARSGLVDLARLHKADGAWDKARCAYQLYLDRFPNASLRPEVERALYKLGEGKACAGLNPQ